MKITLPAELSEMPAETPALTSSRICDNYQSFGEKPIPTSPSCAQREWKIAFKSRGGVPFRAKKWRARARARKKQRKQSSRAARLAGSSGKKWKERICRARASVGRRGERLKIERSRRFLLHWCASDTRGSLAWSRARSTRPCHRDPSRPTGPPDINPGFMIFHIPARRARLYASIFRVYGRTRAVQASADSNWNVAMPAGGLFLLVPAPPVSGPKDLWSRAAHRAQRASTDVLLPSIRIFPSGLPEIWAPALTRDYTGIFFAGIAVLLSRPVDDLWFGLFFFSSTL